MSGSQGGVIQRNVRSWPDVAALIENTVLIAYRLFVFKPNNLFVLLLQLLWFLGVCLPWSFFANFFNFIVSVINWPLICMLQKHGLVLYMILGIHWFLINIWIVNCIDVHTCCASLNNVLLCVHWFLVVRWMHWDQVGLSKYLLLVDHHWGSLSWSLSQSVLLLSTFVQVCPADDLMLSSLHFVILEIKIVVDYVTQRLSLHDICWHVFNGGSEHIHVVLQLGLWLVLGAEDIANSLEEVLLDVCLWHLFLHIEDVVICILIKFNVALEDVAVKLINFWDAWVQMVLIEACLILV